MSGALAFLPGVMAGANSSPVYLGDGQVNSIGSGLRTATLRLSNDGNIYAGDNGTYTLSRSWLFSGAASAYDVYCTVNFGTVTGTTGSWLNLGTTRDWAVSDGTNDGGETQAQITLQIRNASTLVVLASGVWTIFADRTG